MKMVQRVKNTRVGRLVCRLFGEEKGAVMMEYVIVAVLIAAAAVAAVIYFGGTITKQFGVATNAAAGNQGEAQSKSDESQRTSKANAAHAVELNKKFSNEGKGMADQGSSSGSSSSSSSGGGE